MSSIIGIPTTRISNQFVSQQLQATIDSSESALFQAEEQMSTGYQFQLPSQDPQAAARALSLQEMINQNTQIGTNLQNSQTYLSVTDTALTAVSSTLNQMQSVALDGVGTTTTSSQRQADAEQVSQAIQQLTDAGNQLYDGRYIFAGAEAGTAPFQILGNNYVQYNGDENQLSNYGDASLLVGTNVTGAQAFGAISNTVQGTATLNPALTADTYLRDLNGGKGVGAGAIQISYTNNGITQNSTVDLTQADTLGDVARLIQAGAPQGASLNLTIAANGLQIGLASGVSGTLSISNVGGDTTASDLGLDTSGQLPAATIVGQPLTADLTQTTPLNDLLGTRASGSLFSAGTDSGLIFQSASNGTSLNGYTVSLVNDNSINAGQEYCTVAGNAVTVHVRAGATTAQQVATAANRDLASLGITAEVDPIDTAGGQGLVTAGASATLTGGSGHNLDTTDGLQIVNGGQTYNVSLSGCNTVQDVLNKLNGSGAGVLAQINSTNNGINVLSRVSGADFEIGENGGTTAADLGIRSLTAATRLSALNYGSGVQDATDPAAAASASFTSAGANSELSFTALQTGAAGNGYTIQFVNDPTGPGTESVSLSGKQITVSVVPGTTTASQVVSLFNGDAAVNGLFKASLDTTTDTTNDGTGTVQLATQTTAGGTDANADFAITTAAGTQFDVSVSGAQTIGDVINKINAAAQGTTLTAQLSATGNGIQLVDTAAVATAGNIVVTQLNNSQAATGLGLIASGATSSQSSGAATFASATTTLAGSNANVTFTSLQTGPSINGATVVYQNAQPGDPAVSYDAAQQQLTFYVSPTTTAANIVSALAASPYATQFSATASGTGAGVVSPTTATFAGGLPVTLTGTDPNPQETDSVFNALSRLQQALQNDDTAGIQRASALLTQAANQVSYAHAELGAQEQGLTALQAQQQNQNTQLQQSLSTDYDTDFAQAASTFSADETAYQAALKVSASISQMSLINYL